MAQHFQSALAMIFPTNQEDFGVTAVEAMAAGTPVIAYAKGGPKDYIVPGKTGLFFDRLTTKSLVKTMENFKPHRYDPEHIAEFAQNFSDANFKQQLTQLIDQAIKERDS